MDEPVNRCGICFRSNSSPRDAPWCERCLGPKLADQMTDVQWANALWALIRKGHAGGLSRETIADELDRMLFIMRMDVKTVKRPGDAETPVEFAFDYMIRAMGGPQ